jgi:putative endonuclease
MASSVQANGKLSASCGSKMSKGWYVYMLLCDRETFYIGITDDLYRRIHEHKDKKSFFTKKFSELNLVYCEKYQNKNLAAKREKQLKGWTRAKKQMLVDGNLGINACTGFAKALLEDENLM